MRSVRTAFLVATLALSALATGCVALLAGAAGVAGGIVYVKGQLESYESQPLDTVVAAIRKAVEQEEFGDTTAKIEDDNFSLRGKDVDDTRVFISAQRKESDVTRLRIRHGAVGDQDEARRLLSIIRQHY